MPRITMAKLAFEARQLKSEEETNPEYDRGLLELVNTLMDRTQDEVVRTALELGFNESYTESLYMEKAGEADSIPVTRPGAPTPKLHHVVMPHGTVTFTDPNEALEFLGPKPIGDIEALELFLCESEVTGDEYDMVSRWRGAVGGEKAESKS